MGVLHANVLRMELVERLNRWVASLTMHGPRNAPLNQGIGTVTPLLPPGGVIGACPALVARLAGNLKVCPGNSPDDDCDSTQHPAAFLGQRVRYRRCEVIGHYTGRDHIVNLEPPRRFD